MPIAPEDRRMSIESAPPKIDAPGEEEEAGYRSLFERSPRPMWVYDVETLGFLAVNDAAIRHYGYSRAEFLGMTIAHLRPPAEVPTLLRALTAERPAWDHSPDAKH